MAERGEKVPQIKLTFVQYAILVVFVVLTMRLAKLQVASKEEYEQLAEQNRVRRMPILAPRGKILDREGRIIVDNYPSFSVLLLREQLKTNPPDIEKISAGLHIPAEEIRSRIRRFATQPPTQPLVLKDDVTPDELAFIEAHRNELSYLDTIMVHRRLYPKDGFMAHVIGYVGEVSEQMLNDPRYELYEPGDVVGKSGVEAQYNDWLMGQDGFRNVIVNSHGKEVGRKDETPATPGKAIKLTIDLDLQIAAEEALNATGKNGAIIAMDPRSGEILAMVSRPVFDPNHFAVRIPRAEWNALLADPGKPLLNKATQAQLAPGSVFKIIMSVAGLQEGIAQNLHVYCPGGATFYGRFFKCWIAAQHRGHGAVDIHNAVTQSCDVFFYTLAERLGIGKIAKWATALGLGQRTGVDLPQEVSGVMPSEEWKAKYYKQKWYAGETISVGIGQGAIVTTPIQLARTIGGIASGGTLRRPHVVDPGTQPEAFQGKYQQAMVTSRSEDRVQIDPQNWTTITDAMATVTQPGGTAAASHLEGIDFAGKTGSAQVVSNDARKVLKGAQFKDNGWFAGVEPRRNPEIVVVVLMEEGEHGSAAAHLAADVVKAYVDKQRKRATKVAQAPAKPIEMGGLWSAAGEDGEANQHLQAGKFVIASKGSARRKPAAAAPGMLDVLNKAALKPRAAAAVIVGAGGGR
ncbi:MAG: penicillin-binding protein 2 [Candidatus Koribacter versatilis]|uniref:Penicillin-binding protein 2 n=1 Tax=Candidatus Korobacter versatilis TaxID=658062 RepID=A0A932A8D0_9BACT|nr:penicillin-binding protein 2 [Candidatus Koribacter versatilis]